MTKNQEFQERITSVLPKCDDEIKQLLSDLYSYWKAADLELAVFNLRLKKQWTKGSNLYTQEELDHECLLHYKSGLLDGIEQENSNHDIGFRPQN